MKRFINLKMVILTSVLIITLTLLGTTKSQAVLQANPTTHAKPAGKIGADWITQIRQMETAGQTMGLTETQSGLNATSQSNNIDVHMMLPTEYGAVAILSASGYGNPKKLQDETNAQKRTTTGNSTGVYFSTGEVVPDGRFGTIAKYYTPVDTFMKSSMWALANEGGINGWHGCDTWEGGNSVSASSLAISVRIFSPMFSLIRLEGARWNTDYTFAARGAAVIGEV